MATTVLGLKTFTASDPVDYNEINDNYNKIDNGVKTALQGRAAHNLLDNSDFRNPVNQRGKTSYSGGEYAIDRWKNQSGTNMALMDGFIRITGSWDVRQILGKKLIGTYTFAVYAKVNVAGEYIQTIEVFENDSVIASSTCTGVGEWKIYTCTATFTGANNITNPMVIINNRAGSVSDASMDVKWAALYEGSYTADTLPAYQPKWYAAELAECLMFHREDVVVPVSKIKDATFLIGTVIQMRDMGGLKPTITLKKFTRPGVIDVTSFNASDRIDIENLGGGRYLLMNANLVSCMDYASGYLIFSVNADI